MLKPLKEAVCHANLDLVRAGLVIQTWGNVSAVDRQRGVMIIKPSGVSYENMRWSDMVPVSLETGEVIEGRYKPSSDTPTHLVLYRAFREVNAVAHTHSLHATAWAQAGRPIPALGTTHADYFHGPVPCTRPMRPAEITSAYEANTGKVIVETFKGRDPLSCPAVLVAKHGPFAWGSDVPGAVHNAIILEHVARLAAQTLRISPSAKAIEQVLVDKHFFRKHGAQAYYGQGTAGTTN